MHRLDTGTSRPSSCAAVGIMVAGIAALQRTGLNGGSQDLSAAIILSILILAGASGSLALMWLAAGRPDGPEAAALEMLDQAINRLRQSG